MECILHCRHWPWAMTPAPAVWHPTPAARKGTAGTCGRWLRAHGCAPVASPRAALVAAPRRNRPADDPCWRWWWWCGAFSVCRAVPVGGWIESGSMEPMIVLSNQTVVVAMARRCSAVCECTGSGENNQFIISFTFNFIPLQIGQSFSIKLPITIERCKWLWMWRIWTATLIVCVISIVTHDDLVWPTECAALTQTPHLRNTERDKPGFGFSNAQ